jgi:hypothetical protein
MDVHVDGNLFHYQCPHCELWIQVRREDLNCKIFRHGVFIDSGKPIDPHASKGDVESQSHNILGCGGPHMIYNDTGKWYVRACSWSS